MLVPPAKIRFETTHPQRPFHLAHRRDRIHKLESLFVLKALHHAEYTVTDGFGPELDVEPASTKQRASSCTLSLQSLLQKPKDWHAGDGEVACRSTDPIVHPQ